MTIPGVRSTLEDDFYVLLVGWEPIGIGGVTFKVFHNPQVNVLWIGGLVLTLGAIIAALPKRWSDPVLKLARKRLATVRP